MPEKAGGPGLGWLARTTSDDDVGRRAVVAGPAEAPPDGAENRSDPMPPHLQPGGPGGGFESAPAPPRASSTVHDDGGDGGVVAEGVCLRRGRCGFGGDHRGPVDEGLPVPRGGVQVGSDYSGLLCRLVRALQDPLAQARPGSQGLEKVQRGQDRCGGPGAGAARAALEDILPAHANGPL